MRTMKSKRGDTMAFITLDDRTGRIEASLFGELFEQLRGQIESDQVIIVEAKSPATTFPVAYGCAAKM